ncbi:hypothetical protein AURDEDRAFT_163653 [Auricularia subglabra TFB-10046 SS5]|nr:hypothetical protein AURDEDRAFT_163653 [Auricularia subglabra TFB-10046 SS5]
MTLSVSLYARVLHCLLLVTGQPDLHSCAASIQTWAQLHKHAREIYRTYASTRLISELRQERTAGTGDIVLENAALFLRDALGLQTFERAIKAGRSGHIVLALKWLALMFKAGGHPKYAREMLYLLHHLTHVWPPKLRDLILSNWLVNPTGHKDGWVALDLMQEHLNFWIKRMYAAHGSNGSTEWLAMISPCIEVLRSVANQMHATLGSYQGRTHTTPDLTRDIRELMRNLEQNEVYSKRTDRKNAGDAIAPVTDLLTEGFGQMVYGANTALNEHNDEFRTLQARFRVKALQPYDPEAVTVPSVVGGDTAVVQNEAPSLASGAEEGTAEADVGARSELGSASSSSGSAESSEFDDYQEYDELYLRLADEFDVDLDPDSLWEEPEDSGDEQDGPEMGDDGSAEND